MTQGSETAQSKSEEVTISQYILTRLEQVGVGHIFGVPGDFFLRFVDDIEDHPKIKWVGCTNELNASYAADGYARAKGGLGVLASTFGVGELSAANGIAGAYSEFVPILHIVGVPSTGLQSKKAILHHTLGDGRFDAFREMYTHITVSQAEITASNAGKEIDRAIFEGLKANRPAYLALPTDMIRAKIPASPLNVPLTQGYIAKIVSQPEVDAEVEDVIIAKICDMFSSAMRPCILVDVGVTRFKIQDEVRSLIGKTDMTFFTTPMGKTAIDEDHPAFRGVYIGETSIPAVKEAFDSADFVLSIGSLKTDFNTASFSYSMPKANIVELHHDHTLVQHAIYAGAGYRSLLPKLVQALTFAATKKGPLPSVTPEQSSASDSVSTSREGETLTHDEFWPLWASFFQKGDMIIGETGTSSFGLLDEKFPAGSNYLAQLFWCSIGWATGATLGACIMAKEQGRRCILFTGDGSIQLTVQEISTMIRLDLKPIIVVLNNDGYASERFIHVEGRNREYNKVKTWNWQKLLEIFDPPAGSTMSHHSKTRKELEVLLAGPELRDQSKIHLVECVLGDFDAPRALRAQAALTAKANTSVPDAS